MVFSPDWRGTPRRYRLGLSQVGELGHLPSRCLLLFPNNTCFVWGRSDIPHCSCRGALAGTKTPVCLGRSVCTACTPSWHKGERFRAACLGMNACIAFIIPGLLVACLGRSACTACIPSQLRGTILPTWE